MLAGESCGGTVRCNTRVELPSMHRRTVEKALRRLDTGFLAFVGLTDEWNPSIGLFHTLLMPLVPVFNAEYQNMHSSFIEIDLNQTKKAELAFARQEAAFASMDSQAQTEFSNDPDHIIYARARDIFCSSFKRSVAEVECNAKSLAKSKVEACLKSFIPHECSQSPGVLPSPLNKPLGRRRQREAARHLLEHWNVSNEPRESGSKLALIVSGGPISSEVDSRNGNTEINRKPRTQRNESPTPTLTPTASKSTAPRAEVVLNINNKLNLWFTKSRLEQSIVTQTITGASMHTAKVWEV